ncbi:MAG: hypothetical protein KC657_24705 [Myxococcales bacterium]|nr:hypothetical protein [Myxococcales bacterium]
MPASWPKVCRCGETWSRAEWSELTPIGRYLAGSEGWMELRSCVCGATLTVEDGDLTTPDAEAEDARP